MSFLRTANKAKQAFIYEYSGLQIQSSTAGVPIPIVYGTNKVSFNMVWQGGFYAVPQYTKSGGGKGGNNNTLSGYDYYVAAILGLCEGPIAGVATIYNGTSTGTLASALWGLNTGTTPQATWSFLTTFYPSQALPYGGLAYIYAPEFYLGSSASFPSINCEVQGVLSSATTSALVNGIDADPALILQDFLTNSQYGVGFPAGSINAATLLGSSGDASYQTYCRAAGLALSPTLVNQETASAILARWLQLTNTAAVWSGAELKFIPYGDQSITGPLLAGGSVTFTPNTSPIYDLTDDDFVYDGDNDPLQITRSDPYTAKNWLTVEISQRSVQYSSVPIEAWDQNEIELSGLRKDSTITAHEICDPAVGQIAAQLILQRGLSRRNVYQFKLSFEYCLLEPMDIVTLSDAGLGLDKFAVRIVAVEEDDFGLLSVSAEDLLIGSATATTYVAPISYAVGYDSAVEPDPINPPIIFEPPAALTGGLSQIWAAVSGGAAGVVDRNWGGASVYVSLDNSTYTFVGNTGGPARQGKLTGSLAAPPMDAEMADALSVTLAESGGELASASAEDAAAHATLAIVDSELIAYETATLTGSNAYNLTTLFRGLYGSTPAAHSSGAPFARLDNLIFKYALPSSYIGVQLYFKFQSFNLWGLAQQDISTCAVYKYTPTGAGVVGPVTEALLVGANLDYGLVSLSVNSSDDFGVASDPYTTLIDLGLASA